MSYESDKNRETGGEKTWISDKTKIKFSIAGVIAICSTLIGATWYTRGTIEDWRGDLSAHFSAIEKSQDKLVAQLTATNNALNYKWTTSQMEQWTNALDKTNRDIPHVGGTTTGLNVPDPLGFVTKVAAP